MILSNLNNAAELSKLGPRFKQLFDYLASHDILSAPLGRIDIDGDNLYISNVLQEGKTREERKLEIHRKYIDVQVLLEGTEMMGWKPLEEIKSYEGEYSAEKDIRFSTEKADTYFTLHAGQLAIFYPEDGHAPAIAEGKFRKFIAKVRV